MKYPLLFQAFKKHIDLPIETYLDLEKELEVKTLKKKEFVIQEGEVIKFLPFINKGLMVNYRFDNSGNRHVLQIRSEGSWLGDLYSFFSGNPTQFNIQTYSNIELLLISHETFDRLTEKYPIFERFFRISIQNAYVSTLNQVFNLHSLSAEERYLKLIKDVPKLVQDVPDYLIASYLNITPQSLSRIRKHL